MPEPPDFDQIARNLAKIYADPQDETDDGALIARTLREIWNARGAADLKAVADERASDAAVGWIATVIREQDR